MNIFREQFQFQAKGQHFGNSERGIGYMFFSFRVFIFSFHIWGQLVDSVAVTSGAAEYNDKELEFCDKTILVFANLIHVTEHDRLRGGGVDTITPSLSVMTVGSSFDRVWGFKAR